MSPSERRNMIRQENTDLMHEIDRIFAKYPFFGSRQIATYLPQSGLSAGRHRVRRLMGIMYLQGAEHQQEAPPIDLAILAEKGANHAAQSCLVQ